MNLYCHLCIIICCITIFYVYSNRENASENNVSSEPVLLVIGILSARENFMQREAIRSSWLKRHLLHENSNIKGWFIVGNNDCEIPPRYRLSEYDCNEWSINVSGLSSNFYTSERKNKACVSTHVFEQGFSFKVNYPIVIKRLGILYDLLPPNIETKVALLDTQTKEVIVQTTVTKNSSYSDNGYLYGNIEAVLLPKNFEGMVLVEGYLLKEACVDLLWNDGGGVIMFNRIYSTPSHTDSIKFNKNIYSAVNIHFFIHDIDALRKIFSRKLEIKADWLKKLKITNERILKERDEKRDILLVNVTDVYRSLPIKLLQFYGWTNRKYNFSYLMKTDDDTVVDIENMLLHMKKNPIFEANKSWIWSRFRNDWPVNYIGKWADYDYKSSTYPSFPCGAAYVMSHKTVQWLSLNKDFLFPYQGEDVSMGIWLSAMKTNFMHDELFQCDSTCSKKSYNRAQLTVDEITEIWSIFEKCKNLCSCD